MLLRKGFYSCEYAYDWEKVNETSLPSKGFYSHLSMEDITDAAYTHTKKSFEIKKIRWLPWFVYLKGHIIATWCIE